MVEEIKNIIQTTLPEATIYVSDPNQDGEHFQAIVIDPSFETVSLVKQHQVVMNALKEAFKTRVHALALKTFSPTKWENQKQNYNF
ncbi:BolA family transcriptional regulator [Candidatus Marinamargulisbacteria bacterium SCGC AG-414-C22]|nr:BolA family transcriptional regulator [Candidatus Marinamargulisbacteria bacterium SCGC AG-414-C22]